jgi:hemerythrin
MGRKSLESREPEVIIPWKDSYCIDHGPIDDDHRKLIALINDAIVDLRTMAAIANIPPHLTRIRACARAHFEREERLQQASKFPLLAEHRAQHVEVLKKLDEISAFVESGQAGAWGDRPGTDTAHAIKSFLYNWLLSHLIEDDMKMRPYVAEMQKAACKIIPLRAAG